MRCAIWYHLYNLKNMKNTHGGVLILVLKLTHLHGCFSRFLNCANGTKWPNAPHILGETETILEIIEAWKNKEVVTNEVSLKEIHEDDILPKKFSDKNRPNYFLCVRVTNEKIKNTVKMVSDFYDFIEKYRHVSRISVLLKKCNVAKEV